MLSQGDYGAARVPVWRVAVDDMRPVIATAVAGLLFVMFVAWAVSLGLHGWLIMLSVFMLMIHWEGKRWP